MAEESHRCYRRVAGHRRGKWSKNFAARTTVLSPRYDQQNLRRRAMGYQDADAPCEERHDLLANCIRSAG